MPYNTNQEVAHEHFLAYLSSLPTDSLYEYLGLDKKIDLEDYDLEEIIDDRFNDLWKTMSEGDRVLMGRFSMVLH